MEDTIINKVMKTNDHMKIPKIISYICKYTLTISNFIRFDANFKTLLYLLSAVWYGIQQDLQWIERCTGSSFDLASFLHQIYVLCIYTETNLQSIYLATFIISYFRESIYTQFSKPSPNLRGIQKFRFIIIRSV